jgi:hypothetical protein
MELCFVLESRAPQGECLSSAACDARSVEQGFNDIEMPVSGIQNHDAAVPTTCDAREAWSAAKPGAQNSRVLSQSERNRIQSPTKSDRMLSIHELRPPLSGFIVRGAAGVVCVDEQG